MKLFCYSLTTKPVYYVGPCLLLWGFICWSSPDTPPKSRIDLLTNWTRADFVFPPGTDPVLQILKNAGRISKLGDPVPTTASGDTHTVSGLRKVTIFGTLKDRPYSDGIDLRHKSGSTPNQRIMEVRKLRLQGFAVWSRGPIEPGGQAGTGPHFHIMWTGAKTSVASQKEQVKSFILGYRGVAQGNKPQNQWLKDSTIKPDEIAAVKQKFEATWGAGSLDAVRPYEKHIPRTMRVRMPNGEIATKTYIE